MGLICAPAFTHVRIDGQERTGLGLVVDVRDGLIGK